MVEVAKINGGSSWNKVTKREIFAARFAEKIIQAKGGSISEKDINDIPEQSVKMADNLLECLSR